MSGPGVILNNRYGTLRSWSYEEDRKFLFIDYLHDEREHQAEGITSFFVRKSIYLAFFGRLLKVGIATDFTIGDSPRASIPGGLYRPRRQSTSQSRGTPENIGKDVEEDI